MAYIFDGNEWQIETSTGRRPLSEIAAGNTQPFYLYDLEDAVMRARKFKAAAGTKVHFAMKSNSHPRLLKALASEGLGADVVSLGELKKALQCGFAPKDIIFSGVGKGREELEAALDHEILQVNVESFEELKALENLCGTRNKSVDIALRLNIHLSAPTHKNIQTATKESKFGLDMRQLPEVLQWLKADRQVKLSSLTVHIGSQIMDVNVFEQMSREIGRLYREVKAQGFPLSRLDLGGGLGINYQSDGADDDQRLKDYLKATLSAHQTDATILFEPGRFIVARMGLLCLKVVYVKKTIDRNFVILNGGMNCLMRPALYQSYHRIHPLRPRSPSESTKYTIVGPLCETTDTFAEDRDMSVVNADDWLAVFDAGAYGAVMANTYNESPLPKELTVLNGKWETK